MRLKNHIFFKISVLVITVTNLNFCANKIPLNKQPPIESRAYYFSAAGNDDSDGSIMNPFKTINKLNHLHLQAGNSIYFQGGEIFEGAISIDSSEYGTREKPIIIGSYGSGSAMIKAGNEAALALYKTKFIQISNLSLKGSGRKEGNTKDGMAVMESNHIRVDSLDISGFQKAGLLVYSSSQIEITHVHAYENGFAGISVEGEYGKKNTAEIHIADCLAENNPGDPSNFKNHSGNGIVVGHSRNVIIEYCVATNNGWDMPRTGNGPVGIWCYEADSVTIQYCISYANKTAKGADDGGGFDFDGGVTYSIIQHCLSYNNQGSAFGIFQYAGATPWHHNIIRDNISENDGEVSAAHAAVYIWNSSGDEAQFNTLSFYNNIVYNAKGAAIHYADKQNQRKSFQFYDNIFVAHDEIIKGEVSGDVFSGNTWWNLNSGFNIDGVKDFKTWAIKTGKEQKDGKITGVNTDPGFKNPGNALLTDPHKLNSWINYQLINGKDKK